MRATARSDTSTTGGMAARRARLQELLAHLERRTDRVERDLGRTDEPLPGDFEERATALENDDVLVALSSEGRDQIALVRAALARLDAGTYGRCETCGGPIGDARLEALPYAARCIGCASVTASAPEE